MNEIIEWVGIAWCLLSLFTVIDNLTDKQDRVPPNKNLIVWLLAVLFAPIAIIIITLNSDVLTKER